LLMNTPTSDEEISVGPVAIPSSCTEPLLRVGHGRNEPVEMTLT
jgi:hypothetical protein